MKTPQEEHCALVALEDLRQFSRGLRQNRFSMQPPVEITRLVKIWKQPPDPAKTEKINPVQRELALSHWQDALENAGLTALTRRDMRILCSLDEIVQSPDFQKLLDAWGKDFTPSMISVLMDTFHRGWQNHPNHQRIATFIETCLNAFTGRNSKIQHWQTYRAYLLYPSGPEKIANELLQSRTSMETLGEQYRFAPGTRFTEAIRESTTDALVRRIRKQLEQPSFVEEDWRMLFQDYLQSTHFEYLSELIRAIDQVREDAARHQGMRFLQNWFLSHAHFKDPRIHSGGWINIEATARAVFTGWLAQEDIRLFFELIIKNDMQKRKEFWLPYLKHIRGSVIAIGSADKAANALKLRELGQQGYHFAHLENDTSGNSAFILEFDRYIVVDFSRLGRAYLYEKAVFLKRQSQAQSMYTNKEGRPIRHFDVKNLKDAVVPRYALEAVPHQGNNWLQKLAGILAHYGIRPA